MSDTPEVVQTTSSEVSVGTDSLDQLVEANSRPSLPDLASLIRQGKDQGLIKAQQDYAWQNNPANQPGATGSNPANPIGVGPTATVQP